ncbi:MAG: tetratricopeptide repeat protein [Saprospiraceae bacterium]
MFPQQDADAAELAHVLYRDAIKAKDYARAFPLWEEAYTLAPAADGKRPFHYMDGRAIYMDLFAKATDEAKKTEYAAMNSRLYDEQRQCYGGEGKDNPLYSAQIYDMFYTMQRPYTETYPVAKKAIEVGGDKTDFRVITPMGYLVSYMFSNKLIEQGEAREMIEKIRNIVGNQTGADKDQYKTGLEGAEVAIAAVERSVFDCAYFKAKLKPMYDADPNNPAVYQDVYSQLINVGCDKSDPLLAEIGAKDRANKQAEFDANNPMTVAKKMMESGDKAGAIAKLEEIAANENSADAKAAIYLNIASMMRKDGKKSNARSYANKAIAAKPGYGKAYLMLGDLYASSSRSCSKDAFQQRLVIIAALNKYAQAKKDPETAGTAQSRISKYSGSLPTKEMLFERGIKAGESRSTGCWIGETVSVRAAS